MRVGFVGLGNMGLPMAKQIAQKHDLVIFSRSPDKRHILESSDIPSSTSEASVEDLAAHVDALVVCLNTPNASRQVLLEQALPMAIKGTVLIDCSTVPQALSIECYETCKAAGCEFVDAPVSGGPSRASNGTLSVMLGGSCEGKAAAGPVLECMGTVYDMGGPGTGTAAKLVNQLLVGVHSMAACEAMLLSEKLGIEDQGQLLNLLCNSFGYSPVLERNAPAIAKGNWKDTNQPISNMVKDMTIVSQVIEDAGLDLPVTKAANELHQAAADRQDEDMALPYQLLKDQHGIE